MAFHHAYFVSAPNLFGLPAFDEAVIRSDSRDPLSMLPQGAAREEGHLLVVDGKPAGRKIGFMDWSRGQGHVWDGPKPPNRPVILMDLDYFCPLRNRVLLHAGCVYRAPGYIVSIRFAKDPPGDRSLRPEGFLDQVVANLRENTNQEFRETRARHQSLLRECNAGLRLNFGRSCRILRLNEQVLCSGVSASILAKMIAVFLKEGRNRFDYREFKYDPALFHDPKRTSFETHLARLESKLSKSTAGVSIVRTDRGRIELKVHGNIELQYQD